MGINRGKDFIASIRNHNVQKESVMSGGKKNSVSLCGIMAVVCLVLLNPLSAAERYLGELSLLTDTNAVLDVASGDVAVIDVLSGNRGTVTKTGGGLLRVCQVVNDKVKFVVNGGKLLFDRPQPSALDKAFFHVDSSRSDTLLTEELNGTNFVVRWNDVRGNGVFATNCMYKTKWRSHPERRRAFISSVKQNGMPVVDFGEMLHEANTNSLGEAREGYGASMIWNETSVKSYEVFEVVSDTPDVATIATLHPEFDNTADAYQGVPFLSYSLGRAGARRGRLKSGSYPLILTQTSSNYGWMQGRVYLDRELTPTPNNNGRIYGKVSAGAGFHLLGFTTREYNEELDYTDASVSLNSFARDYNHSFGGQRLAEYLVFTNRLTAVERKNLQEYLYRKWKGGGVPQEYLVSSISVADGASVEMAPGIRLRVAHVAEGADVNLKCGVFEINPLNIPEANFHVDASCAESISAEMVDGTNFVNHWADVLSNGVYATAASSETLPKGLTYLPDPENRRPYISDETLNGLPVVDFGSLLFQSRTNEFGYGIGYGASMKWSKSEMNTHEVFTVTKDTPDVNGLGSQYPGKVFGMSHICIPDDARLFRGLLTESGYPSLIRNHSYNNGMSQGVLVVDGDPPIKDSEQSIERYTPTGQFQLFNFQLTSSAYTPNWFAYGRAKDGSYYFRSFGGTKIAEYIALPVLLSNDVRQAVHSALRTKWFGIEKREMSLKNLAIDDKAKVTVPWNSISVAGTFSIGGEVDVSAVSAANVSLTREGAVVSGSLTLAAGATVNVRICADGTLAGVEAKSVTLSGGGKIVLIKENSGAKTPDIGSYPVIVAGESFSGALDGWSLDASVLGKRSCALELRNDGIYLKVAAKGLSFVVR